MRPMRPRRDPAPSRLAYRLGRLWLSPRFRFAVRRGLPLGLFGVVLFLAANDPRLAGTLRHWGVAAYEAAIGHPAFRVDRVDVTGADAPTRAAIAELVSARMPASSLTLDLAALRDDIATIPAVLDARLALRPDGVLAVDLSARRPVALLRDGDTLHVIDGEGIRIGRAPDRSSRGDLPLLVGAGAERAVAEALTLATAAEPFADRIRAFVRVGERRWDIVLDRDQRILLPEIGAREALLRVVALHMAEDLLERDVARVDLRDPERPV
ncbi:MAG: cell division protein FtsQ/DivIB, partial [Rubricella sp.]